MVKSVLVTLTSPSAAGKSYLLNHIRDAGLPCLISTTTRFPRAGEVEGYDYFFISEEESKRIEAEDGFAELAIFNGKRYGVTKQEFKSKLDTGLTFLIVEPSGIDHYVKPALDVGAVHLKYYIHTDPEVRIQRFRERALRDISEAISFDIQTARYDSALEKPCNDTIKTISSAFDRFKLMLTTEMNWGQAATWDRILFGDKPPAENLEIILRDVESIQKQH